MSDEESFVVLNDDSTSENRKEHGELDVDETYSIIHSPKEIKLSDSSITTDNSGSTSSASQNSGSTSSASHNSGSTSSSEHSISTNTSSEKLNGTKNLISTEVNNKNKSSTEIASELSNTKESLPTFKFNGDCSETEESLAHEFLTGKKEKESLEAVIFSHFPSITNSIVSNEEIAKLQSFFSNYVKLVDTVQKNTDITKGYYSAIQKWRNEAQTHKEEQLKHIKSLEETIAKLTNENLELKKEIKSEMQNIKVVESVMKEENTEIIKQLSEKAAHIEIMKNQIETLEQHQLGSFEYVKRKNDNKETEYITTGEHQHIVKNLEADLSVLTAQNLEFEDMKTVYIDELNCLKTQLTACEELLLQARADIQMLKCSDLEKSNLFEQYVQERNEMKEQIKLLQAQIDIYSRDFQMEKTAKEAISNERDAILSDLKLLQERNQTLVEEAQEMYDNEKLAKANSSWSTSTSKKTDDTGTKPKTQNRVQKPKEGFDCPICGLTFKDYQPLQIHANVCAENLK